MEIPSISLDRIKLDKRVALALAAFVCAILLLSAGQAKTVIALFACLGTLGAILFAAGLLQFGGAAAPVGEIDRIIGSLPAAIAVTDKKGAILWESNTFGRLRGKLGLDSDLSRLGAGEPNVAPAIFRLFTAGRKGLEHVETIKLELAGSHDPLLIKVAPVANTASTQRLIWQIEEIRTSAVETLSLRSLLEALPVPALLLSADMSVKAVNKSFEKLCGSDPTGNQVSTLLQTRRGNSFTPARLRETIEKTAGALAVQIADASGFFRPASIFLQKEPNGWWQDHGNDLQLWVVWPTEASGQDTAEAFETLLSRLPVPMALANPKGIVLAANRAFKHLFAAANETENANLELVGKPLAMLVAPGTSQKIRDKIVEISEGRLRGAANGPIDVLLPGASGKSIQFRISQAANETDLIIVATEQGSAPGIDQQAAQSQKLQAVGELAGGIAHDFNNHLTAIIGFSDLLLRRFRASDPVFKDLMDIKHNATRAAELVKQILAYSRRQTLRPAVVKLTDIIEEYQATMGRTLGEKVKLKVRHGRDLWFIKADEGQLFQVIMNLAVNARDAMPEGGEISIRTANVSERESLGLKERGLDRGEYVMCEVRDTGTGIKPEHLDKIFDPFFSTKEVGKGTGLGLSTVHGIVKQTGGTILVDSEFGAGTAFRIFLPRYVETEQDLQALASKAEAPEKIADLTGQGTVLLVEDEDAVRSFASRALQSRGYKVLEASSGVEALDLIDRESGQVDLVLSDVVMPEMDGPTLLRHLRQRNPNVRIVFMSGYAEEAFSKNLSDGEEFVFLPKPFTLKTLAETVKAAAA